MATKVLVISSGGLDSTTCISMMVAKYGKESVSTVTAIYGQRLKKEVQCARNVAKHYGLKHFEINLTEVFKGNTNSSLILGSGVNVKEQDYLGQYEDGKKQEENFIISSYVPFRNGLFISSAAALGMGMLDKDDELILVLGNHADDYAYADCSMDFIYKMDAALKSGTYGKVRLIAPIALMTKAQIVKVGLELGTPYELTWSCYEGEDETKGACGKCGSCLCRLEAFRLNGAEDPIAYEHR